MQAMFSAANRLLDRIPKASLLALCVLLVAILGFIDIETGYEFSFAIFYLIPIMLAAWYTSRSGAVAISVLAAITWLYSDIASGHVYSYPSTPYWNASTRFGFFLIISYFLTYIRVLLRREAEFSRVDTLTGISNSRHFHEIASTEFQRTLRSRRPITVAYIDLDNFKAVNDTFGHSEGDTLLAIVAATIKKNLRGPDTIARLGGDEFAVLLPESGEEQARQTLERVRNELLGAMRQKDYPVTFSIGSVTCTATCENKACDLDIIIKMADNLMYEVKNSGKNNIRYKTCPDKKGAQRAE